MTMTEAEIAKGREAALARILSEKGGMERLRRLVRAFGNVREDFNDECSVADLLLIQDAWRRSEWDIYPDQWEDQQVAEALGGRAPTWDQNERPTYVDMSGK